MADATPQGLTAKGAATRTRIVEAAADHVLARGVRGTSLDDIRAATRTSKSQLFHYFPDGKAELVRALVDCQVGRVIDAQRPAIDALDTWEAWTQWRDAVVRHYTTVDGVHGCPIGSLAGEAAATDPKLRAQIATSMTDWQARLRQGVERMRDAGLLRPEADPESLALGLLAAVQGGLVLAQAAGELRPLEVALDGALDRLRAQAA